MRSDFAFLCFLAAILIVLSVGSTSKAGLFRRTRATVPVRSEAPTPVVTQVSRPVSPPAAPAAPCVPQHGWSTMPHSTADFSRWPPYFD